MAEKIRYTCLGKKQADGNRVKCGFDVTPAIEDAKAKLPPGSDFVVVCSFCGCEIHGSTPVTSPQ